MPGSEDRPARIAWATDLHLPHARGEAEERLLEEISRCCAGPVDALVLTGDIGVAETLAADLRRLSEAAGPVPVHFVLGNHDFYGGSIPGVRRRVAGIAEEPGGLRYLGARDAVSLTDRVALVGHDGWGDARLGNWEGTRVRLNDFRLIEELASVPRAERTRRLRSLGDEAARHLERGLRAALPGHDLVVVATHVPPFADAAWHEGGRSDPDWLPYFACRATGEAILRVARDHRDRRVLVLCGHTHSGGEIRPTENVRVLTGEAEYGRPELDGVLEVG